MAVTTRIFSAEDPNAIAEAAAAVLRGELIILPTDTVYGVGTCPFDEQAVDRLYIAKQRSRDKGIPILIADVSDISLIVADVSPQAEELIARFWPGPLTLVLPKRNELTPAISKSKGVAVRMPDHDVSREVIRAAGGALATTSANLSGRAPAQTVKMALYDLAGVATVAIDAGPSAGQLASTVVDCTGNEPRILRTGPITMRELRRTVR